MLECIVEGRENVECLPDIIECENLLEWNQYLSELYTTVFKRDFIDSFPCFDGKEVHICKEPMDGDWEHSFIHMTHEDHYHKSKDPNDRIPDLQRAKRLPWARRVIEKYKCSAEYGCGQIWYWEELYRNSGRVRVNLLYEEESYLVVLERLKTEYMIITSFYLEKEWELEKRRRKYQRFLEQKTPLV